MGMVTGMTQTGTSMVVGAGESRRGLSARHHAHEAPSIDERLGVILHVVAPLIVLAR